MSTAERNRCAAEAQARSAILRMQMRGMRAGSARLAHAAAELAFSERKAAYWLSLSDATERRSA